MSNYQPTPEDRMIIAQIPTDVLVNTVSQQLVPEIVEIMIDELNARYTFAVESVDYAVEESQAEFDAALDALLLELDAMNISVEVTDEELPEDFSDFYGDDEENWF